MKKCPFCAEEIPDEVMICPLCQQDLYFTDQEVARRDDLGQGTKLNEAIVNLPKKFLLQPGERVVFISRWKVGWNFLFMQVIVPLLTMAFLIWLGGVVRLLGWILLILAVPIWLNSTLKSLFGWAVLTDRRIVCTWAKFPWKQIEFPLEQVRELVAGRRKMDVVPRNGITESILIPEMQAFVEKFDDLIRMDPGWRISSAIA